MLFPAHVGKDEGRSEGWSEGADELDGAVETLGAALGDLDTEVAPDFLLFFTPFPALPRVGTAEGILEGVSDGRPEGTKEGCKDKVGALENVGPALGTLEIVGEDEIEGPADGIAEPLGPPFPPLPPLPLSERLDETPVTPEKRDERMMKRGAVMVSFILESRVVRIMRSCRGECNDYSVVSVEFTNCEPIEYGRSSVE